jgi:predicted ATP-grasp superfamily ATP-dependent carboligase
MNAPLAVPETGRAAEETPAQRMLPAVVLGIDTPIGLAIVRSLGRRGVAVYGIARSSAAPGLSSRYLRQGMLRAGDAPGTLEQLEGLVRRIGPACLFAIPEDDIALLNRHRDRLSGYRLMFPDACRMDAVRDKEKIRAAAGNAGLPVLRAEESGAGYGLGQFFLMHEGQAYCVFQHRRLHEWPPEGGVPTLCESVSLEHHAPLRERSVALLRELDWEGVAMVEYRYDPQSGAAVFRDIHGGFRANLPLACHAGADFPWLAYSLLGVGVAQPQPAYRAGLRCRFMIPETKRLARLLFRPGTAANRTPACSRAAELAGYLGDFMRPSTRHHLFTWSDPVPLLRAMWHVARRTG